MLTCRMTTILAFDSDKQERERERERKSARKNAVELSKVLRCRRRSFDVMFLHHFWGCKRRRSFAVSWPQSEMQPGTTSGSCPWATRTWGQSSAAAAGAGAAAEITMTTGRARKPCSLAMRSRRQSTRGTHFYSGEKQFYHLRGFFEKWQKINLSRLICLDAPNMWENRSDRQRMHEKKIQELVAWFFFTKKEID